MRKPEIGSRIIETALKVLKVSEKTDKDPENLSQVLEEYREHRCYQIPDDFLEAVCEHRTVIAGGRPCVIASPYGKKPERALLLFYGGGYYKVPGRNDFEYLAEVVRKTGTEVWFPLYPLAPEADIKDIMTNAAGVYSEMLKKWKPEEIVWQGNSCGGTTCLYLLMKISHDAALSPEDRMPNPARVLLVSPAVQMPPSEEQQAAMRKIESEDAVLSVQYCTSIAEILQNKEYEYLKYPFSFDWTGFPPMMVIYGTKEIFSVFLPGLRQMATKYRLHMKGINGKDRIHCWPLYGNSEYIRNTRKKMLGFICGKSSDETEAWDDEADVEFACIYTARDDLEARMIETLLRDNNIPCFRRDLGNAGFLNVYAGNSRMGVSLFTAADRAEEVRRLLEETGIEGFEEAEPAGPETGEQKAREAAKQESSETGEQKAREAAEQEACETATQEE
ncbi:MAG: alpha/beta hydrolase fold domain-containing protein [Blautia sp.]|nr:alpha/beta hydrolase fold domain-containing protein [Blautia sp.]